MRVILDFQLRDGREVDVGDLHPQDLLPAAVDEIERRVVRVDGECLPLGEVCRVKRLSRPEDELVLRGQTRACRRIGAGMQTGWLLVEGDAGWGAGLGMAGGDLLIRGSAGDCLGAGMQAGRIRVSGSAGDGCGADWTASAAAMAGGQITIGGSVGCGAGSGMRRGVLWIAGDAGDYCAERLRAGTLVCGGRLGRYPGQGMKRGSLLAGSAAGLLPGFLDAGPADVEWLRIFFRAAAEENIHIPAGWRRSIPRRFTGDHLEMGKGEVLVYGSSQ